MTTAMKTLKPRFRCSASLQRLDKKRMMMKPIRPNNHFTPKKGWINDPNGAIKIDDTYHLFYQHYPDDTVWGPMHWGHATTKDLIHWNHEEIAIKPDHLGYIFSGSTALDTENVSGFSDGTHAPLIAMYTSHHPETNVEQQSISYSLDHIHFIPYEGNPVIENHMDSKDFKKDFRDPKIFKNEIKGGFSVVLAAGPKVEFYHTTDFKHFEKTGEFDPSLSGFAGTCECPDVIHLKRNEKDCYLLTISMILPEDKMGLPLKEKGFPFPNVMQYFLGTFDGNTFIETEKSKLPRILDYGPDNYAEVSFFGTKEPLLIGWGENWNYVNDAPGKEYRGKMTYARTVDLLDVNGETTLTFQPFEDGTNVIQPRTFTVPVNESLVFQKDEGTSLEVKVSKNEITIERTLPHGSKLTEVFKEERYRIFHVKRFYKGDCDITVTEDHGYFELFMDHGTLPFSIMVY